MEKLTEFELRIAVAKDLASRISNMRESFTECKSNYVYTAGMCFTVPEDNEKIAATLRILDQVENLLIENAVCPVKIK